MIQTIACADMRIRVHHLTRYRYPRPAALGPHVVRLRPADHARSPLLAYDLRIEPEPELRWQRDPWNNRVVRATFPEHLRAEELTVRVEATFDLKPMNPFDFYVDERCERVPFAYPDGFAEELRPFLASPRPGPRLAALVEEIPRDGYVVDWLVALNGAVRRRVAYIIREEPGIQAPEETLERGSGSCRDSALLLCALLRARGIAARFVSGYLVQLADEGIIPGEARGVSRDVVDLHAWAEAFIPGAGWVGLDGTSGLLCGEGHVALACTVDPQLASPITGTSSEPASAFHHEMRVERLGHEPRPRRPYTEETWTALLAAGERVDGAIADAGLVLTVGGEPTWTSREHPERPEWQVETLGETKWRQGIRLVQGLLARFGTGPVFLQRMGKQYPGESLPRWVLELVWRADGVPIWRDAGRLASPGAVAAKDREAELDVAERFGTALAQRIGVEPLLVAGYEDPWISIREEQNLPVGVDPLDANLADSEERRRLAQTLARGLGRARGFALPIQQWGAAFRAVRWRFRREHMFLLPGDSPMGLRLPLDRVEASSEPGFAEDTTLPRDPFAFDPREQAARLRDAGSDAAREVVDRMRGGSRTALCFEPREGVLHVFLPPLTSAQAFLELVAEIEDTAAALDLLVRLEGYAPPPDARLRRCLVTPDPGVLEVNVPPSASFREYVDVLERVADAANHAGLTTDRYQLDGRETGSGGGNHVTLGGPWPTQSPFLQRPALLGGLLRYVQNHPSLSYLFTGLFTGPTSQAPRVDEARHDSLYELELALGQIRPGVDVSPWWVDRLLRNLLVDVSGNTHRTEICIDKLYDPAGPNGRLGLVELRAFEMPPHERMAAAQVLLVRALVAMLARASYEAPLVRWGSRLHDRFALPHFLWRDLEAVLADLAQSDLTLDPAWFSPFLELRCPVAGVHRVDGIEIELRTALEPWPVLGEQPVGSLVARHVDSSLERMQVRVRGLDEGRFAVGVNGWKLPLVPTEREGERIAGVRFRAWQPPHCLQPHVGIHHPLRFDLVDTWGRRSLGACTYHVWHPEGRAFEAPPLTAFEAAARRAQRFTTEGHAPSPVVLREIAPHPEQPVTLDLRRCG